MKPYNAAFCDDISFLFKFHYVQMKLGDKITEKVDFIFI